MTAKKTIEGLAAPWLIPLLARCRRLSRVVYLEPCDMGTCLTVYGATQRLDVILPWRLNKPAVVDRANLITALRAGAGPPFRVVQGGLRSREISLRCEKRIDPPPIARLDAWDDFVELPSHFMRRLRRVAEAALRSDYQPELAAVKYAWKVDQLVAADGFRLRVAGPLADQDEYVLLHRDDIELFPPDASLMVFKRAASGRRMYGVSGSWDVTAESVTGAFPHTSHLVPPSFAWWLRCSAPALRAAVEKAGFLARDGPPVLRLIGKNGCLHVIGGGDASDAYYDLHIRLAVPAEISAPFHIAMSPTLLGAALAGIKGDVGIGGTKPSEPITVVDPDDPDYLEVAMPMFVNWSEGDGLKAPVWKEKKS